jgi:prepilin-type N-terminal cleavage/methylation domain-containing protein
MIKSFKQRGFTLVEMSIVLVVIGLILGAVSIGGDLRRNAEYAKIKNKFVDQWVQAYNTHYERAGVVIGDNQTAPKLMVNGEAYAGISGGVDMSSVTHPGICHGSSAPGLTPAVTNLQLHDFMDKLGIRMPPGRAEGQEDRYVYLDSNGNPQEVQVCFKWNKPRTPWGSGNVMLLTGLTPDLARYLDQMIDGKPDASEGFFRQQDVVAVSEGIPGLEWQGDNTLEFNGGGAGAEGDEIQVITVVAHYKMNQ